MKPLPVKTLALPIKLYSGAYRSFSAGTEQQLDDSSRAIETPFFFRLRLVRERRDLHAMVGGQRYGKMC